MPLTFTCPDCGSKLKIADNLVGKKIKCPKCSASFPSSASAEDAITAESPPPSQPEGVTPTAAPQAETAEEKGVRPRLAERNLRKDPATEAVSTIIPYKNAKALIAYYCGVFSLIPCAGLVLGPIALILGILGLRYVKANPTAKGTGHAIAGVIMGGLTSLGNWGVAIAFVVIGIIGATTVKNINQPIPRPPENINPLRKVAARVTQPISALAFSPDGKTLAVAGATNVELWELATVQSRTIPGHAISLAFSADGAHLAVGRRGPTCSIELWNPATAGLEKKLFEGGQFDIPETMAFSRDGALFAATTNSGFNLWDTATWQKRPNRFQSQNYRIHSLALAPNGKTLALGWRDTVLLWDTTTMKEKGALKGRPGDGEWVSFSTDGKTVAAGNSNGTIKLWDAEQRKELHALPHALPGRRLRVLVMAFSPDGKTLASSASDEVLKLWDVATGKELANRPSNPPGQGVNAVAFSPDGKMLVTGDMNWRMTLKVWDLTELRGPNQRR